MKILLVYPLFADALWANKHALKFIGKKASSPPLGLLTVAAMLPEEWPKKLVDMNVTGLSDVDIQWADYVFLSAMLAQQASAAEVVARCKRLRVKVVGGGPLFSVTLDGLLSEVDHIVVGEAETSLPSLILDLEQGCARHIYELAGKPDVGKIPIPLWSLVNKGNYTLMSIQFTRGCPFDCEFCSVVTLNGHQLRVKDETQIVLELEALYRYGWRGHVFVCDDNFLGDRRNLRLKVLSVITEWMQIHDHPFILTAAASIDLADHDEVMDLMVKAGFDRVTVGIESPDEKSLAECYKLQNQGRDLLAAVKKMQKHGLEVQGGFIVGFDNDSAAVFERQIDFIQESGIATAMVSLLFAFPETRLYHRLEREDRLSPITFENNAYGAINFVPKMGREALLEGHQRILKTIYSPRCYFERVKTFLVAYEPCGHGRRKIELNHIKVFLKATWILGVRDSGRQYYWRLLAFTLRNRPRSFPTAVRLAVTGYHFQKDIKEYLDISLVA